MKRTLCTLAIAGCAAALAPAGAAAAKPVKKPKAAKFLVQVVGTQTTTWNEPRRNLYSNCRGQWWAEGAGQETVEFRTKESKVLIAPGSQRDVRLRGTGTVERTGERVNGVDPDPRCWDGGETRETTGPYDCRSIPVDYDVDIDWGATLAAIANPRAGSIPPFQNCPVKAPHPVIPTKFSIVRSEPFRAKDLFSRKARSHEVVGQAEYRVDDQLSSAEAKVRWTIRFRRVK